MKLSKFLFYSLTSIIVATLIFGIFLSRYDVFIRRDISLRNHPRFFDYHGATHVLSKYSQGSADINEIATSASQADLNFVYITDLNDFDLLHQRHGYSQDVLLFTGKKISYLDSHLLLYGHEAFKKMDSIGSANAVSNDFLNRIPTEAEHMTIVLAHPFKQGFQWQGPYPEGLNGIEVMNLRHMWQSSWNNKKASFIWSLFIYIFNPKVALLRLVDAPTQELILWDSLNEKRKTVGFLGNHATGKIFSLGLFSISFPTYEDSFKFASNHILLKSELTGVESIDSEKVQSALMNGHSYFSIDALANPKGFAAYMSTNDGSTYLMGEKIPWTKSLKLLIDVPPISSKDLEVKLLRNGQEIATSKSANSSFDIDKTGNYRVYVRVRVQFPIPGEIRWIPWIYSNNFYVR